MAPLLVELWSDGAARPLVVRLCGCSRWGVSCYPARMEVVKDHKALIAKELDDMGWDI